ncbi:MAG: AraC family transcriptional regulator [Chthoniobacteraceae bacterium]|nr:AraC family transcriptional regulator [Chthoniobacteraceae bacterium]
MNAATLRSFAGFHSPAFAQASPLVVLHSTQSGDKTSEVSAAAVTHLSEKLLQSQIVHDYERAFSEATGLPLKFVPAGKKRPGMRGSKNANAFCIQMAENKPGCRMCVEMQERLGTDDAETKSEACMAGLTDSAVPVRVGQVTLGFLQTGQIALQKLKHDDFRRVVEWLQRGGVETDLKLLEESYFKTRVVTRQQYEAVLRMLEVFAQHLSLAAEQIATQQTNAEPPMIQRARALIEERQGEELSLKEVAQAVHVSTFHFCKMFKRATGLTFTEYLSLVRVAKAKKLLANPQLRISEIAFEAGFSSITHFNRMFHRIAGRSPTSFREVLCGLKEIKR